LVKITRDGAYFRRSLGRLGVGVDVPRDVPRVQVCGDELLGVGVVLAGGLVGVVEAAVGD